MKTRVEGLFWRLMILFLAGASTVLGKPRHFLWYIIPLIFAGMVAHIIWWELKE